MILRFKDPSFNSSRVLMFIEGRKVKLPSIAEKLFKLGIFMNKSDGRLPSKD